ncbi:signal peptide peptidase SppA [Methanobacterium alkalithermotolerans]|uniref:Signal peptide peptidase SppA n=1 Tax=Methanobacterium alkalithermotolerans TaxID=2731220 RepID=A0A8T8K2Z9_9EURY|nr:signal peptide peptidase SppA [Methanobacterium alkalithermotolerans]QUH22876.1 signal peptide peptidase SppA [Methanobacterium alkalithermotolerans]
MDKKNKMALLGSIGGLVLLAIILLSLISVIGNSWSPSASGSIAVIPIYGQIAYSPSSLMGSSVSNPDVIKELIQNANQDVNVKAILLEVNSPGGSPVASEEIMESVQNSEKPVVVWISDTGASGAYLVASGADRIVASPSSWVGSIGVLVDLIDLSRLYDREGINKYAIKGGEYKDMGADYRELTPEEKEMMQNMVDEEYDYFIEQVAKNRNLSKSYVAGIAEGKIYTGRQAKNLKLVDDLGGKDEALDIAAHLAGIKDYTVVSFAPRTTLESLLSSIGTKIGYALGMGIGENMNQETIQNIY